MYPYIIIDLGEHFRLGLYDICLMIAIVICLVLYRVFADRQKFKAKIQNFALNICGQTEIQGENSEFRADHVHFCNRLRILRRSPGANLL